MQYMPLRFNKDTPNCILLRITLFPKHHVQHPCWIYIIIGCMFGKWHLVLYLFGVFGNVDLLFQVRSQNVRSTPSTPSSAFRRLRWSCHSDLKEKQWNSHIFTYEQSCFFRCGLFVFFLEPTQRLQLAYATTMGAYAMLSSKAFAYAAYAREVLCGLCLRDFSLGQIFELGNGHLMG